ncbi:hypothetical protein NMY22_g1868 [Coprinellus aureogranulatus]|nr:hypothetical protein NMY22_g1868 [Coprinellus aureogranulatus]
MYPTDHIGDLGEKSNFDTSSHECCVHETSRLVVLLEPSPREDPAPDGNHTPWRRSPCQKQAPAGHRTGLHAFLTMTDPHAVATTLPADITEGAAN